MDFNKLTIKSGEAVAGAQELARRAGNPELTRDHLTVALLEQELPRTLLQRAGADPSAVLRRGRGAPARAARRSPAANAQPQAGGVVPEALDDAFDGGTGARRRVRLGRAPRARARARAARGAARRAEGGARRPARDDAGSGGHLRGARRSSAATSPPPPRRASSTR